MSVIYFKLRLEKYLFISGRIIVKLENDGETIGYDPHVCLKEDSMGHHICRFKVLPSKCSLPDTVNGLMSSAALSKVLHCLKCPASPIPSLLGAEPSPSSLLQHSIQPPSGVSPLWSNAHANGHKWRIVFISFPFLALFSHGILTSAL